MGLLELASSRSFWRGVDYWKSNRVKDVKQIEQFRYQGKVEGSKTYEVELNLEKPRSSTCTCPFAEGRYVVCKHMVAVYLNLFPEEYQRIENEIEAQEAEEERLLQKERDRIRERVWKMAKDELREELYNYLVNELESDDYYW